MYIRLDVGMKFDTLFKYTLEFEIKLLKITSATRSQYSVK